MGLATRHKHDIVATFVAFFGAGVISGSWAGRIPAVKEHLGASLSTLGIVLLMSGIGSLLSMPFGARLQRYIEAKTLLMVAAVATAGLYLALVLTHRLWLFSGLYLLTGIVIGLWDIVMNTHGAQVELAARTTIMPQLHGTWGAGMLLGSAAAFGFARLGVGIAWHLPVVVGLVCVTVIAFATRWSDLSTVHEEQHTDDATGPFPWSPVLAIGLLMLCGCLTEGAAVDWLALYVVEDWGATQSYGTLVYTVYALALTLSRLTGGWTFALLGRVRAVRLGGILAGVGILLAVVTPWRWLIFLGVFGWGIGIGPVFPSGISAAGERGGAQAAKAIGTVSTFAYGSFLMGPPLLGVVGDHFGLRTTLIVCACFCASYALLAKAVAPKQH